MKLFETPLAGAFVIDIDPIEDERGFFARAWASDALGSRGLSSDISQCNISFNKKKHTVRGLHFQVGPHEETKVVRCTRGALLDVIVDVRRRSPTFLKWYAHPLNEKNHAALYIPGGFAHGFQTLDDDTEVFYMMSSPFVSEAARTIHWRDPEIGIRWPEHEHVTISRKDAEAEVARHVLREI